MKKIVSLLAVTAAMAVSANAAIISGYDFQSTPGTAAATAPNSPLVYAASFGTGSLYLNGANGSSTWVTATSGNEVTAFSGTAVNAGPGYSTTTTGAASLALLGGTVTNSNPAANGKSFVFTLTTTGYQDLVLTYATQKSSATAFSSVAWSYSTDGSVFTSFTTISTIPTSFATATVDFTGVSALYDDATVYIKGTVGGATSGSSNNRFDNIQFNATPIGAPEPSTLTGLVLGGTFLIARRRRSLRA